MPRRPGDRPPPWSGRWESCGRNCELGKKYRDVTAATGSSSIPPLRRDYSGRSRCEVSANSAERPCAHVRAHSVDERALWRDVD